MNAKSVFDFDSRIAMAWQMNRGEWPKSLTSGVMFYEGLRITVQDFNAFGMALGQFVFENDNL